MQFQLNEEYTLDHIKLFVKNNGYRLIIEETPYCDMHWGYLITPPYIHIFDNDVNKIKPVGFLRVFCLTILGKKWKS